MEHFFSIIIPVRSINTYLKENILNLKQLTYPLFEVIILTDTEKEYDFENDDRFRLIAVGSKGPGEKRNIGVQNAKGNIVVFLDDDAYPSIEWLEHASNIFNSEDIYALGAPAITPKDAGFLEKCSGYVLESPFTSYTEIYRHIPMKKRYIFDYPTVNLFVKKKSFNAVGGFITEFWPGEDTKLCLDLVKKYNQPFLYSPKPIVYHHRRNLFRPHLKQISRYGRHRGQFARIFPETSRIPSYFIPSLFVLGLFLGMVSILLSPFIFLIYITVVGIYVSCLLIESIRAASKSRDIKVFPFVLFGIFLTHIVYGINFIIGFFKKPKLKLRGIDKKTGNYLGG